MIGITKDGVDYPYITDGTRDYQNGRATMSNAILAPVTVG